jgi:2-deoxy-D-gluconate 3-dehydrogenase
MDAAAARFCAVDILFNNAGRTMRKAAIDVTREERQAVMEPNLTGTFFLTTAFARRLIRAGLPGCVVNIASVHGMIGVAERSTYGISKGALIQMTRMLAIEWAEAGIRVNAISPGRLITDSPSRSATATVPSYRATMLERVPLHRFATAEDVAATASFLAGPQAAAITGQVFVLDGGLSVA